jgi:hypothetical protein
MSGATLDDLTRRLERLERQNRGLKLGVLGAVAAACALVVVGAVPSQRVVEAEKFVLRDDAGRERAVLEMANDKPALRLYDAAGKKRTSIGPGEISLCNDKEAERINLGVEPVDEGNGAAVAVLDANGKTRIGLLNCQIGPALVLNNSDGETRAIMGMMPAGIFAQDVARPAPKPGSDMAAEMTALGGETTPHIYLLGAKGNVIRQWPPAARVSRPGAHN